MRESIRVMCVDDHAYLVGGLRARLEVERDMEFVGHQPSAADLGEAVAQCRPDIVILDIEMPGPDAFEAINDLHRRFPDVRTILLSAHVRDQYLDRAYRSGAWGYLSKSDPPDAVIDGIRRVSRGELAFSPGVLSRSGGGGGGRRGGERGAGTRSRLSQLTDRERTILRMIARGLSRTRIAQELHRSPMTIDNHRKSIMRKLAIHDRGELVRYAINEGLD